MLLKPNFKYLLRNDGQLFEFKNQLPSLNNTKRSQDYIFILKNLLDKHITDIRWLYDNTQYLCIKQYIELFVKMLLGRLTLNLDPYKCIGYSNAIELQKIFPHIVYNSTDFINDEILLDILAILDKHMNQEFITIKPKKCGKSKINLMLIIEINSIWVNWLPLINKLLNADIEKISITTALVSDNYYSHNDCLVKNIPIPTYLTLFDEIQSIKLSSMVDDGISGIAMNKCILDVFEHMPLYKINTLLDHYKDLYIAKYFKKA